MTFPMEVLKSFLKISIFSIFWTFSNLRKKIISVFPIFWCFKIGAAQWNLACLFFMTLPMQVFKGFTILFFFLFYARFLIWKTLKSFPQLTPTAQPSPPRQPILTFLLPSVTTSLYPSPSFPPILLAQPTLFLLPARPTPPPLPNSASYPISLSFSTQPSIKIAKIMDL